jgi:hypothetical protein
MNEGGWDLDVLWLSRLVLSGNPANQEVYRSIGDLRNRLCYYRHSRLEDVTKVKVIVGDQSDVLWHAHPSPLQRPEHTYRNVMIA